VLVSQDHDALIEWVGRCVLPWEAFVRAWLRKASVEPAEIDDIVQEAYGRIASLESFGHIANARAYFLEVARNVLFEKLRRSRIIRIDTVAEIDALCIPDDRPDQERTTIAKDELVRLMRLIDELPERCRKMFVLRKIEGLSQKQIAQRLGVTENTVETQVGRGLKLILNAWTRNTHEVISRRDVDRERKNRRRKRD
jgi:RNA polymerase sigma factor (sigma-70 family)